jgi:hypothetical protein
MLAKEFKDQIRQDPLLYFKSSCAEMRFWGLKKVKSHTKRGLNFFFSQNKVDMGVNKIRNFTLTVTKGLWWTGGCI